MLIVIDPADVTIEPEQYETGLSVLAMWRGKVRAGLITCLWEDEGKTRLMICDLEVYDGARVKPKSLFRREQRANFRGLLIGKRLLREVIRQAPLMGARELFGKVVERDLEANRDLLNWYAREGFEICAPIESDPFPPRQVARIEMRFDCP